MRSLIIAMISAGATDSMMITLAFDTWRDRATLTAGDPALRHTRRSIVTTTERSESGPSDEPTITMRCTTLRCALLLSALVQRQACIARPTIAPGVLH